MKGSIRAIQIQGNPLHMPITNIFEIAKPAIQPVFCFSERIFRIK